MFKHSDETKKKLIQMMLSGDYYIESAARELGVSSSTANRWWRMYSYHGMEFLNQQPKEYSKQFKIEVAKHVLENNLSANEASALFLITGTTTVTKWVNIYKKEGESGFKENNTPNLHVVEMIKDKDKIKKTSNYDDRTKEDLIYENKVLKAQVDYLKKSIALKEKKKDLVIKKKQW